MDCPVVRWQEDSMSVRKSAGLALILMLSTGCATAGREGLQPPIPDDPRCCICRGASGHFEIDPWGNCYHTSHVENVPRCHQCDRRLLASITGASAHGWLYDDGRAVCGDCWRDSVGTVRKAKQRMRHVCRTLAKHGISVDTTDVHVKLVPYTEGGLGGDQLGSAHTQWTEYATRRRFDRADVQIVLHLSEPLFDSVLAHELMHVWIAQNTRRELDARTEEGVCQLASHLVLRDGHDRRADYLRKKIEKSQDPVYGDGYRRAKRYVDRRGMASLLNRLRKAKKL
jgi:hypothetical protein